MKNFAFELGSMKKPAKFTLCPYTGNGQAMLQSDKQLLLLDVSGKTNFGLFCGGGNTRAHMAVKGAKKIEFEETFIDEVITEILRRGNEYVVSGVIHCPQNLVNLKVLANGI